jgi:hypothetical protein
MYEFDKNVEIFAYHLPEAIYVECRSSPMTQQLDWTKLGGFAVRLLVALVVCCGAPKSASACYGPPSERMLFFAEQDIGAGVDAPIIADVTIQSRSPFSNYEIALLVHVDRIIKGPTELSSLRIVLIPGSCDRGFDVGAKGIIFGRLTSDAENIPTFIPVLENFVDRSLRRRRSGLWK